MPTYEYEREDGTRFEIEQKITEDALETCPTSGQKVKRLVSAAPFHLKGSGWYKTDYASSSSGAKSSSPDSKPSTTSSKDSGPSSSSTSSVGASTDSSSSSSTPKSSKD